MLKVALENRPSLGVRDGVEHIPFAGHNPGSSSWYTRPYNFWQWRATRPYAWPFFHNSTLCPFPPSPLAAFRHDSGRNALGASDHLLGIGPFSPTFPFPSSSFMYSCRRFHGLNPTSRSLAMLALALKLSFRFLRSSPTNALNPVRGSGSPFSYLGLSATR